MQKIKLSFSCLLLTAFCLLFLSPATASASTYQDVENFLKNNPAPSGCVNWIEEVLTPARVYRVWRRCGASGVGYRYKNYFVSTESGFRTWYDPSTHPVLCNGTPDFNYGTPTGATLYGYDYKQRDTISCDGAYEEGFLTPNTIPLFGLVVKCRVADTILIADCRVYDTLLAEFIPVDQCLNQLTNAYESCAQNCKDPVDKATSTQTEICGDGIDNNCDGQIDEGCVQCVDNDNDGYYAYDSANCPEGNDCNDNDPSINPSTVWYKDADNDGYSDGATLAQCAQPDGYKLASALTATSGDCDDSDASANINILWYKDSDGDSYSDGATIYNCRQPAGYSLTVTQGDCNDNDASIKPGASEKCDGKDNNCNNEKDEGSCSCSLNLPISSSLNIANGNLSHNQELFTTKGAGLSTNITLYYDSLYQYNGPLGIGWTHAYDISLKEYEDSSVLLRDGGNGRRLYTRSGGSYISQAGDYSTLTKNADSTFTISHKDGLRYNFSTDGKITTIIDRNNNTITFTYTNGNLTTITDPANKITTLTYNADNRISAITDPNGNTHNFTYTNGMLTGISTTNSELQTTNWSYTYNPNGFILTKTDPNGYTTTYTYDSEQRLITAANPEGTTKTITYSPDISAAQITESDGGIWTYTYDIGKGALTQKTDPENNTTTYTYDNNKNLISRIDPDGTTTTYIYDQNGNMTGTTDAMNQTTSYTYNDYGQITSITAHDATTTSYTYDATGNLISMTDSTGAITKYEYDTRGNISKITNPAGQTTLFTYDQYNNLTSITDPTGATSAFTYDNAGNMTSQTDANGNITRFEYNSLNQLIKTIDPQGNATAYTYDKNGNKTSQTDANGNTTYYEYNYKGQLTKVKDALNNTTTYTYGGTGCTSCGASGGDNLTSITDAKNQTTTYEYDSLGRLTKEKDPLGNTINYPYDSKGNLISKTDANGATITYTYDSLNRLLKKKYPDNTEETFTYDAKGNILTAANQYISYTFTYDSNGKIIKAADSNGRVLNYQYNPLGNKTKTTYPDGSVINYTYDNANRLASIINGSGRTYTYQYDTLGRRTKLTYPNAVTTTYSYDSASRLTSLLTRNPQLETLDSYTYTHDKIGNRLTMATPNNTATYTYDKIYRILSSTYSNSGPTKLQNDVFTYDPVGNRLTSAPNRTYTYNNANQLINYKGKAYIYDKNGNLTIKTDEDYDLDLEIEGWAYTYDYENRLIKITKNEKNESKTITFKYDPFGRRIEKKVEGVDKGLSESRIYTYVYDNEDIILEYLTKTTNSISTTENTRYIHGPGIDEPLAMERNGEIYYYHADGLGSITAMTDSTGKIVQAYEYDAFGDLHDSMNAIKQPYTYTGREWDRETGLYYYRARYYDAEVGRFISFDPIVHPANGPPKVCSQSISYPTFESLIETPPKLNPYVYTQNNPTTLTDPSGLGPNSECITYAYDCLRGIPYACVAFGPCSIGNPLWGTPNSNKNQCVRNCLLDKYNGGCKGFVCQTGAHAICFTKKCRDVCNTP